MARKKTKPRPLTLKAMMALDPEMDGVCRQLAALALAELEQEAPLGVRPLAEVRADPPRITPALRLDADDVRAEIAEHHAGDLAADVCEVEDSIRGEQIHRPIGRITGPF